MRKMIIIGACALAMAGQAHASTAVIAAAATASAAGDTSYQQQQAQQQQHRNAPRAYGGDWESVGWLFCPRRATEPTGCKQQTDDGGWGAPEYNSQPEPWIDWMKRYKGENARLLGLMPAGERGAAIKLFYGVLKDPGDQK